MDRKNIGSAGRRMDVACSAVGSGAEHAADEVRNANSRRILGNAELYAQFIRDNVNIPELAHVQPEDIEDVSERYQVYLGIEFEADTVKRIRLRNASKEGAVLKAGQEAQEADSVYLVSLVEHKSRVDYDVAMQILRYTVCIWDDYAREMEKKQEGITKQKGFRYPPVLPIVYYEGRAKWSADMHLGDRICMSGIFGKYMPDFTYQVVRIHDYSNEELIERGDAISLIMLINKIQSPEDFTRFRQSPPERLEEILKDAGSDIRDIIKDVMYGLLMKMKVPVGEAKQYVEMVEECRMGFLFENMEEMDIQAERQNTAKERKKAEEFRREAREFRKDAEEAKKDAEEAKKVLEHMIKAFVLECRESGRTREDTADRLVQLCGLEKETGEEKLERYWKK